MNSHGFLKQQKTDDIPWQLARQFTVDYCQDIADI